MTTELFKSSELLHLVTDVVVPANVKDFSVKEKFDMGEVDGALVPIEFADAMFTKKFLTGRGKIERPTQESVLRCSRLLRRESHWGIILGFSPDKRKCETRLSTIFSLLERYSIAEQQGAEQVIPLQPYWWNAFFAYDLAIGVIRGEKGWRFSARHISDHDTWGAETLIFTPRRPIDITV